ncbi:MAG: TonB-dependent receptor [Verrucomicrobiota bacterium]
MLETNDHPAAGLRLTGFLTITALAGMLAAPTVLGDEATGGAAGDAGRTNVAEPFPKTIVYVEKQPAAAQSLPVSLTPVTGATLEDAGITTVKDAAVYAPDAFINEFTARKLSNPYFRGLGSSPNNPGVTTYLDGVPQLNANSSSLEFVDVDQIEFVRGPQGALYGRNTVGGLINITSRQPSLTTWSGGVDGDYGNYNLRDVRVTLSGPVVQEQAGLSLAGGYTARDGYTLNDATGHRLDSREDGFGKAQFLWRPWENWEVRLILSGESDRDGDYALGDLGFIRANPHHVSHDFEGYTHRDVLSPTLLVSHQGAATEFASITGLVWWQTRDLTDLSYDPTPVPVGTRDNQEKDLQFTQEFRLASAKDAPVELGDAFKLSWKTGVFVFTQSYEQEARNNYAPGILSTNLPFPVTQLSPQSRLDDVGVGAYAQTTLTGWEKLDLTVGLRGDYENKHADLRTSYSPPIAPATALSPSQDFAQVTPQFALAYHPTADRMIYGTVSRGYKAGGFNPLAPAGYDAYGEETSWNYEIGAKTSWLDGHLQANLAAFYINWSNLQLNQPYALVNNYYIANAGNADSKGVELELNGRPLPGWDLFGGASCTDAHFLSGAHAIRTDAYGNSTLEDVSGNHLIYAPQFTANAGTQYAFPISRKVTLFARAEVVVFGDFYYDPANTASQSTYSLANFRAGLRGRNWFVEGWTRNAFDTHYVPLAFEYPNGRSGLIGESGAPATFGLHAGLEF